MSKSQIGMKGKYSITDAAVQLLKMRYSVIPVNANKRASVAWKQFQNARMSSKDVPNLFRNGHRLAIVAGAVSDNLECLDIDDPSLFVPFLEALEDHSSGLTAKLCQRKTPNGYHIIYRCQEPVAANQKLAMTADNKVGIETRGEGGYFLHPPSAGYSVIKNSLLDCPVLTVEEVRAIHLVAGMFDKRITPEKQPHHSKRHRDDDRPGDTYNREHSAVDILDAQGWEIDRRTTVGVGYTRPGKKDGTSGVLLDNGNFYVWSTNAHPLEAGQSYSPFALFTMYEHGGNYKSAAMALSHEWYGKSGIRSWKKDQPEEERKKKSTAQLIIETITQNTTLFHDQDDTPFARYNLGEHKETWPLESQQFKGWVGRTLYEKYKMAPNKNAMTDAFNVLAGQAIYDGQEMEVFVRVSAVDGVYYLDPCWDDWRIIKIEPGKWQITDDEKNGVAFRRTSTMRPLPVPKKCNFDILPGLLTKHLNMSEQHARLIIAYLIECLMPDTEYPVTEITGSPGSGKSTIQEMIRDCIDPNKVNLRSAPKTIEDIFVSAVNNHLVSYNNLSKISSGQSDALCSLSTGGGHAGRKLFTNTDESATDVKKPVILNGIGQLAKMPDLIDRLLKIQLQPILSTVNKPKKQVMDDFSNDLPKILGALLDLFSKVLTLLPGIELNRLPRMADFAKLCEAITQAYRWDKNLLQTYYENRATSFEDSLETSPTIMAVVNLVKDQGSYKGTIGNLYNEIEHKKKEHDSWIQTPRGLGEKLRLHTPALKAIGIDVSFEGKRRKDGYHIELIWRNEPMGEQCSPESFHLEQKGEGGEQGEHRFLLESSPLDDNASSYQHDVDFF